MKVGRLKILILFGALNLTLSAFAQVHSSEAAQPPVLKVGMILALSGLTADYGVAIHNTIGMAQEDRPELFTRIRFLYEDAEYDTKKAVNAFQKLAAADKVDLIYTWGVTFCKALAPMAETLKLPMVGQCIDPSTAAGRPHVYRFMNYTDQYQQTQLAYLKARNLNRIGIVLSDNAYLDDMFEAMRRNLLPGQTVSVVERFPLGEMNLRSAVSKLKHGPYDVVGVLVGAGQMAQFYKQAREQNLTLPTFGTNWFESVTEVRAGNGAMDGAVFANNEIKPAFLERYRKRFGNESQLAFAAPAYEFAILLGELFNHRAAKPGSGEIVKAFAGVSLRPGTAAGPYYYRNDPRVGQFFEFPLVMKRIQGEEFVVLK